jgi:membrane-associated phospholipid phosphatase
MPKHHRFAVALGLLFTFSIAATNASALEAGGWTASSSVAVARAFTATASMPPIAIDPDIQVPPGPEPHPTPAHTGFKTLAKDTLQDFKAFPQRRSTWVFLGIGAGLAAAAHPIDDEVQSHITASDSAEAFFAAGKFLGAWYTQVAASLGMYAIGRWVVPRATGADQTNKWSHLGFDLLRAQILSQAMVHTMKYTIRRDRPTGECCSFPSGHAATAFAAASVIERHLGYRFAWPTVAAATYVATSRLVDNRHFLSDVVFGSALGLATGWTVVGRHGRDSYAFVPVPVRGGMMLALTRQPD